MGRRLYQITDTHTRKPVPGVPFFADKMLAKATRRDLNGETTNPEFKLRYVVSPGPDHRNYKKE